MLMEINKSYYKIDNLIINISNIHNIIINTNNISINYNWN
jgi:hypothetical protein